MTETTDVVLCQQCHQRPATETWVGDGGWLAYSHGMYSSWCKRCCVEAQLTHARESAAAIPDLEAQLQTLVGEGE